VPVGSKDSAQAFVLLGIRSEAKCHSTENSHKGVIDSNNENFAGIFQLLGLDIARDVGIRA
jgi:hypothetical protein